jgi:hypothetical protein
MSRSFHLLRFGMHSKVVFILLTEHFPEQAEGAAGEEEADLLREEGPLREEGVEEAEGRLVQTGPGLVTAGGVQLASQ